MILLHKPVRTTLNVPMTFLYLNYLPFFGRSLAERRLFVLMSLGRGHFPQHKLSSIYWQRRPTT